MGMKLGSKTTKSGRLLPAVWLAVGAVLVFLSPSAVSAQTPAGTSITASVDVRYEGPDSTTYQDSSNVVMMVVAQIAGVDVEPPGAVLTDPGATVFFSHTLQNVGNGLDSISCAANSANGWTTRIYVDTNGNGNLDAGETELVGPVALNQSEIASFLVAVDIPPLATVRGITDTITVVGTSGFDGNVFDAVEDLAQVRTVGSAVTLVEAVDRTTATTGDLLTYTITYSSNGTDPATGVEIQNVIPLGTTYVPGTLIWNGAGVTDATGDDAGVFDSGGNRVLFQIGDLNGGDSGTVSFQVRVN